MPGSGQLRALVSPAPTSPLASPTRRLERTALPGAPLPSLLRSTLYVSPFVAKPALEDHRPARGPVRTAGWGRARWYQPPLPGSRPERTQAPRPQDLPARGEWGSRAAADGSVERDGYKTSAPFEHCGLETSGLSISLPPPPPPSSSRSNEQTHHQPHTLSPKASAARYRPNV